MNVTFFLVAAALPAIYCLTIVRRASPNNSATKGITEMTDAMSSESLGTQNGIVGLLELDEEDPRHPLHGVSQDLRDELEERLKSYYFLNDRSFPHYLSPQNLRFPENVLLSSDRSWESIDEQLPHVRLEQLQALWKIELKKGNDRSFKK